MGALVYHQIVGFCETPLAVLANEFTLWTHLAAEIRPAVIVVDSHYSEHFVVAFGFAVAIAAVAASAAVCALVWVPMCYVCFIQVKRVSECVCVYSTLLIRLLRSRSQIEP